MLEVEEFLRITTDAVVAIDPEQRIVLFNRSAEVIFGYTAEEALGQDLDLLIPTRAIAIHRIHIHDFAAAPESTRFMAERQEIAGRRRDGSEFPAEASIAKILRDGETYFLVFLRDITRRKGLEQARRTAVLEERQKLARELHDSVSQVLYSIGLGLRTARELLKQDPEKAVEPLDYCISLVETGLTEMRALIFELRPEALEAEGVVSALTKLAAAVQARHSVQVETAFCDEPHTPLAVKEAIYRIAQEALHNMIKHANATRVEVALSQSEGTILLEIQDNGKGFVTAAAYPGHLGLHSMRERAEGVGGSFKIESQTGTGVRIQVRLPQDKK